MTRQFRSPLLAPLSRRLFVGLTGGTGLAAAAENTPSSSSQDGAHQRVADAYDLRLQAARIEHSLPVVDHPTNNDEAAYPSRIGNFSKGLPHNSSGEVDRTAYSALLAALGSESPANFENIPMGFADPGRRRKLVNPLAGAAFVLQGADSHQFAVPPAPSLSSAEAAGEMVELYWQALARDVAFSDYATNPLTNAAATDLSRLSNFRGPASGGSITTSTLFRGFTAGDLRGPYLSQFLVQPIPFGAQHIPQTMRTLLPGVDYLTSYPDWLAAQNGAPALNADQFDVRPCYIRCGRDLAQWVHVDVLYQAYFNAALILMQSPDATDLITGGGMGAPLNPGNPYLASATQQGFGTFGAPAIATAVTEVATLALKAVWYQKWFVHRRLRPEEYGGRVDNLLRDPRLGYPVHGDVLHSAALDRVRSKNGSALLPMAFPEGCPLHPSYGAGHATVAGACTTMLKALFDESYVIPNPLVVSPDGQSTQPYTGPDAGRLTVGGELNKLASNIALGRNFGGVHWRSDYAQSLKLGESVALSLLQEQKLTYRENFQGFTLTRFDGTRVTV